MLRRCEEKDFEDIHFIVNDAARRYRGVIPADCWREPYMPRSELRCEIAAGVMFWGDERQGILLGVMGIQNVQDVTLIRHAYTRMEYQSKGVGSRLLNHLCGQADPPILVGTWAAASWAIRFYEKHGFRLVPGPAKDLLLRKYWAIADRQLETSVVLANMPLAELVG